MDPWIALSAIASRAAHGHLPAKLMRSLVLAFAMVSAIVLTVRVL